MQRAVLGELRVRHVARQAEGHRLAGLGVHAEQDHAVGADAIAALATVAAQQEHVDPLAAVPRVLLRDLVVRRRRDLVVVEDVGHEVRRRDGVLPGPHDGRGEEHAEDDHREIADDRVPARPLPRPDQAVGRPDDEQPHEQQHRDDRRHDPQHLRVEGQVHRPVARGHQVEVAEEVPEHEAEDAGPAGQHDPTGELALGEEVAGAGDHRRDEGQAEGAGKAPGTTLPRSQRTPPAPRALGGCGRGGGWRR